MVGETTLVFDNLVTTFLRCDQDVENTRHIHLQNYICMVSLTLLNSAYPR